MMNPDLRKFGLTDRQAAFVSSFVETGNRGLAAKNAGFAGYPLDAAARTLRVPAVAAAIHYLTALRFQELAPVAVGVLAQIMRDDSAPKGVRVDAAKTLLDRAGHIAPKARDPDRRSGAPLNELSIDELRAVVERLESDRGSQAPPSPASGSPELTALLG